MTSSSFTATNSGRDSRITLGWMFFRFDDKGKIVEHWDVLQVVPETSANGNGMF